MSRLTDKALGGVPKRHHLVHIVDTDDDTSDPKGTSKQHTVEQLAKGVSNIHVGFFDYNDLDTATTPIVVTAATSPKKLTNDELGDFTNKDFAPDAVTDVWLEATNEFDWSELALGDMIDIRVDIEVTTTVPNQSVQVDLRLASGGFEYTIPFEDNEYKTAGVKRIVSYRGIYLGDANTLDNGGYFEVSSDSNCTVKVNGWYCKITRR